MNGASSWRLRPGASASSRKNGFFFLADGMAAFFIGAVLLLAAGALAVQALELHRRAAARCQAVMVGRQAMERWKAGLPLPDEIEVAGHRYGIRHRQYGEQRGYTVWEVEVDDEGGKPFFCRRLGPIPPKKRLDDDGYAAGHDLRRPSRDSLPAPDESDREL
ncbi:hypothetical protein [Megasphaera sp.]|uniref:hypothetical protein n=1 Tax=Megasphaera sp. TaxID=2023260 RepID=UPI0027B9534C|nr:hypothetical protein [Megasphaera sp.]